MWHSTQMRTPNSQSAPHAIKDRPVWPGSQCLHQEIGKYYHLPHQRNVQICVSLGNRARPLLPTSRQLPTHQTVIYERHTRGPAAVGATSRELCWSQLSYWRSNNRSQKWYWGHNNPSTWEVVERCFPPIHQDPTWSPGKLHLTSDLPLSNKCHIHWNPDSAVTQIHFFNLYVAYAYTSINIIHWYH